MRPNISLFRCVLILVLAATFATAAPAMAQQLTALPERLMIGPDEYLKAPTPFPVTLSASSTNLDSIRAKNLAPREWGMANLRPCRPVALVDTLGWKAEGTPLLPQGFSRDTAYRSYHGGLRWKQNDLSLAAVNNWWGIPYDSAGHLTSCRVRARAGEYVAYETRTATGFQFTAFPYDPAWGPSGGIVGVAPTEEALRIMWTAFMQMIPPRCNYMTGSPVRDPRAPPC
jgi:hypothetical protein